MASPASAMAQATPAAATRLQRGAEANLLVLEVELEGHVLSDSLAAYQDGGQILLPLGELARLLTIAIAVQPGSATASGFVIREEKTFELSIADALVSIQGRQKSFEPRLTVVVGDEIYVSSRLLAHWLPIDFEVDLGRLRLDVKPRERLPLQERLEREDSGARLSNSFGERPDLGYPLVMTPYAMASIPFADQTFGAEALAGRGARQFRAEYTGYFTGDVFGMEGAAYLSTHRDSAGDGAATTTPHPMLATSSDGSESTADVRVTLARHDPDAGLLGPLRARSVVAGGIIVPSVPNVMLGSPQGNGVMVSNRPLDQPTSFDRHTFRGNLPPGWDVTLYYNDALIAYQSARGDGQYSFDDLPLSFGPNDFRLVFNGPLGQVRVERQSFLLDRSVIAPGETFYSVAQHRSDHGNLRSVIQVDYGLTQTIAANAAFVRKPRLGTGEENTYAQAGIRGYFQSMILGAQVTQEQGRGTLAELAMKTRVFGYSVDLVHLQRQGRFESDLLVDASDGLRYRDTVRANGTLKSDAMPPITLAFEATRDALSSRPDRYEVFGRASAIVRGTALSNSFDWLHADGPSSAIGSFQVSRRVVDVGLSTQIGYTLRPRLALDTVALTADRALGDAYRATVGVQRTMTSPMTLVSVGLTKNLGTFGLGVSGSYSSTHQVAIGLQLFLAIGREPRSGAWMVDAQPIAGTGAISARAFVDRNQNGIRDPGEEFVPNAGFVLNGGGRHPGRTDAGGTAFIGRLSPGQYTDISLDASTLEDPQWKPTTPGYRVLPRPGIVEQLEFPVVATSEVEGTVYLIRDKRRRPIGDARIELADGEGRVVASTRSSADGYYLLHQVMPGAYALRIAPEQAAKLQLTGRLARPLSVSADGDFLAGQDFDLEPASR